MRARSQPERVPSIGVSACLLGEKVRYDGGDKYNAFIAAGLAGVFELLPICPEVEAGMGVPRPPIRLVWEQGRLEAVRVDDSSVHVGKLLESCGRVEAGRCQHVCGYIFKSRSPSCGVTSTPIEGGPTEYGAGLFARQIMQAWPLMPVVEEVALESVEGRVGFIDRVWAYADWRQALPQRGEALARFHQQRFLNLLAHDGEGGRQLQQWLQQQAGRADLGEDYGARYMALYKTPAMIEGHSRVFRYIAERWRSRQPQVYNKLMAAVERFTAGATTLARLKDEALVYHSRHPNPAMEGQRYFHAHQGLDYIDIINDINR